MDDPILMSRLEALRNHLNVVAANLVSKAWQREQGGSAKRAELLGESLLWTGLETTLINEIRRYQAELKKVEEGLTKAAPNDNAAGSAAWVRYAKIQSDSQGLLRECLEIIGTLAIREKDLDHRILHVADELIRDCLTLSTGGLDYYLLVHGLSDTFSKTRARIIRLRFPEWTIWDLPLAAHELGHLVISAILAREKEVEDSLRVLTPFLGNQRDYLIAQDSELNQKHQDGGDSATEAVGWAEGRVRVLLADAFATYTMGPAYACSAIMLRLSPSVVARRDVPSDGQRAQVVLSMLRWMDDDAGFAKPYTKVITSLETNWENTLDRSNQRGKPNADDKSHLAQLADVFGRDVSFLTLNGTAKYPHSAQYEGYGRALEWAGEWLKEWEQPTDLSLPQTHVGKLRDVLNAAWACRQAITGPPDTTRRAHSALAKVSQELCTSIIASRVAPSRIPSGAATT